MATPSASGQPAAVDRPSRARRLVRALGPVGVIYVAVVTAVAAWALFFDGDLAWNTSMVVAFPFGLLFPHSLLMYAAMLPGVLLFEWWLDDDIWVPAWFTLCYTGAAICQYLVGHSILRAFVLAFKTER